jgi:hypothetical protein
MFFKFFALAIIFGYCSGNVLRDVTQTVGGVFGTLKPEEIEMLKKTLNIDMSDPGAVREAIRTLGIDPAIFDAEPVRAPGIDESRKDPGDGRPSVFKFTFDISELYSKELVRVLRGASPATCVYEFGSLIRRIGPQPMHMMYDLLAHKNAVGHQAFMSQLKTSSMGLNVDTIDCVMRGLDEELRARGYEGLGSHNAVCDAINGDYPIATKSVREAMCSFACKGKFVCHSSVVKSRTSKRRLFSDLEMERVKTYVMDEDGSVADAEKDVVVDEHVLEAWWEVFCFYWPLLLPLVTLLVTRYNAPVLFQVLVALIDVFLLYLFGNRQSWVLNVAVWICLTVLQTGDDELNAILGSLVGLYISMAAVIIHQKIVQILIAIFVVVLYGIYIHAIFFKRKNGTQASLLVLFCILYVLHEQLQFCIDQFGQDNVVMTTIRLMMNCMIPYGRSRWYFKNATAVGRAWAVTIANVFPAVNAFHCTLFSYAISLILFAFFRVCVGSMYMNSLRWKLTFSNSGDAFLMYCTGLLQPFEVFFAMVFGSERFAPTRFAYGLVAIVMTYYEVSYASGFFVIRVIISLIDYTTGFRYGRQLRHLYANVNYMGRVFHQHGNFPNVNVDRLCALRKAVKRIRIEVRDGVRQGSGFMRKIGDKIFIFTIRHMVEGATKVTYGNVSEIFARPYSTGISDPIVGVCVKPVANEADDAIVIQDLSEADAEKVDHLVSMQVDSDLHVKLSVIPYFRYSASDRTFVVQSTFVEGDSGSPVFAVMDTGQIYYCGAVSAGNTDENAGNIVSVLLRKHSVGDANYNSDSDESTDFNVYNVAKYVKQRALTDVVKHLNNINGLMLVGDLDYGWREMTEEEFHNQYDPDPTNNVDVDSDDEAKDKARKKRAKWKKKLKNNYNAHLIKYAPLNLEVAALRAAATIAFGNRATEHLLGTVAKHKGKYCVKEGHHILVNDDGDIIEDDNPTDRLMTHVSLERGNNS